MLGYLEKLINEILNLFSLVNIGCREESVFDDSVVFNSFSTTIDVPIVHCIEIRSSIRLFTNINDCVIYKVIKSTEDHDHLYTTRLKSFSRKD